MNIKAIVWLFVAGLTFSSCIAMNTQSHDQSFLLHPSQTNTLDVAAVAEYVQNLLQQSYTIEQVIAMVQNTFELPQGGEVLVQKIYQLSQQGLSVQQIVVQLENECDGQFVEQDNTWKWVAFGVGAVVLVAGGWYFWNRLNKVERLEDDPRVLLIRLEAARRAEQLRQDHEHEQARLWPEQERARQAFAQQQALQHNEIDQEFNEGIARVEAEAAARRQEIEAENARVQRDFERIAQMDAEQLRQLADRHNAYQAQLRQLNNDMLRDVNAAPVEEADRMIENYQIRIDVLRANL